MAKQNEVIRINEVDYTIQKVLDDNKVSVIQNDTGDETILIVIDLNETKYCVLSTLEDDMKFYDCGYFFHKKDSGSIFVAAPASLIDEDEIVDYAVENGIMDDEYADNIIYVEEIDKEEYFEVTGAYRVREKISGNVLGEYFCNLSQVNYFMEKTDKNKNDYEVICYVA